MVFAILFRACELCECLSVKYIVAMSSFGQSLHDLLHGSTAGYA